MNQNEKNTKLIQLCLAIELNRQQLEHAVQSKDHRSIDETWAKLVQLESHLADIMIQEYLKRGA